MLIQLPNGLVDGQDLFNYAEVDELRGKQQNYLVDKKLIGNVSHVKKILEDMTLSLQTKEGLEWKGDLKEALQQLPLGDLETILVKIRENTFGPKFFFEAKCDHCEEVNKQIKLKLDELELDVYPVEKIIEKKEVVLPKSKIKIELKPGQLKDLHKLVRLFQQEHDALYTNTLAITIKTMGIPKDKNAEEIEYSFRQDIKPEDIDDIPVSDLNFLQDKLDGIELQGSIDTDVIHVCSNCNKEFETKINVFDPNFFAHTRGSTS